MSVAALNQRTTNQPELPAAFETEISKRPKTCVPARQNGKILFTPTACAEPPWITILRICSFAWKAAIRKAPKSRSLSCCVAAGKLRCIAPFYIKRSPYRLRVGDAVLGSLPALAARMIMLVGGRGEIIFAADDDHARLHAGDYRRALGPSLAVRHGVPGKPRHERAPLWKSLPLRPTAASSNPMSRRAARCCKFKCRRPTTTT